MSGDREAYTTTAAITARSKANIYLIEFVSTVIVAQIFNVKSMFFKALFEHMNT